MRAGYVGRMGAACGKGAFTFRKLPNLNLWLDSSDPSVITKAYQNLTPTGSGTSGSNTITASATMAILAQVGNKIRIGGTDIYTIASISTVTITTIETLSNTYVAQALALDSISQINDKSGNANNATEGTAASQPSFVPSIISSRNAMGWNSTNTNLVVASSASIDNIFANGGTHIYVIKPRGNGGGGNGRLWDKAQNLAIVNGFSSNLGNIVFNQSASTTTWAWTTTSTVVPQNSPSIIIITYNASSAGTAPNIYINSHTATPLTNTTGSGTATSDASSQYNLGNRTALDRSFDGLIAEVALYKRILSAQELGSVLQLLSVKYGIVVS